ncbi:SEN2 (YLR105C) [Zygosaccharomyces parabailii]|uniref:tRNA-splicing endonuclease subunit Sen2 n=1 Tax=Zygosaccharomyces bailii (strain CLIB 213 / ATCC 58445 / CBS 680 / BCRC 21525 / NBRC 1098 / NCYC 1416 / NRRL Y-2227) TaxID=1333698 RepID=A0A8J2X9C1_ZYGB2|nr:SEN2 (YLR105C) [Zygosaccharomyces parabailii]CDF90536.1 ZYBA0S07-03268g1_1 [Zygosaccharomyces bailii CLIB 213]CDH15098.1 probable tRNA-splicing endonuclease subunit SEN2 [Zygosaccharomyces bailii ISA1307]SJM84123.1 probable tRNA-splicing endonuclease subunit SEN2 [Zygosaccharomyces bailii]
MAKKKATVVRYRYPLPIHPLELPPLIPHNPLSWAFWAYSYITSVNSLITRIHVDFYNDPYVHILVRNEAQMVYLWENGFFGTGQLSRSEPTWKGRTINRLAGGNSKGPALEKVTETRRLQRLDFKRRREEMERKLLDLRKQGGSIEQENELLQLEREALREFKSQQASLKVANDEQDIREVDSLLFNESGEVSQLEALELMPVEAIFLSFAMPVLDITAKDVMHRLVGIPRRYQDIAHLIQQYVAYHHYRSHGWCVRSGVKFGCDYLLYQRGPPLEHAEFCVRVLSSDDSYDYTWYSSLARVVAGASKTYVLCYVESLEDPETIITWWKQSKFRAIFSSYKVGEVVYKRWMPGKNRD